MSIKAGDHLPEGRINESTEFDPANGCPMPPQTHDVAALTKGEKIVIFGLPGAYSPTCSAKHVPGFVANYDKLKAKGVDDIRCLATNNAFVMAVWGRRGVRSNRYAMVVQDGAMKSVAAEGPGKFELSSAEAVLATL